MLIDTHCHLDADQYDADREDVITRAREAGVTRIIIPAVDISGGEAALSISASHDGIFAAVGIHPNSSAETNAESFATIGAQAKRPKVVAIGEIGLDYYR